MTRWSPLLCQLRRLVAFQFRSSAFLFPSFPPRFSFLSRSRYSHATHRHRKAFFSSSFFASSRETRGNVYARDFYRQMIDRFPPDEFHDLETISVNSRRGKSRSLFCIARISYLDVSSWENFIRKHLTR